MMNYNPPQERDCDSMKEYSRCFDAYNLGFNHRGQTSDNPFDSNTDQNFWWNSGYKDALDE